MKPFRTRRAVFMVIGIATCLLVIVNVIFSAVNLAHAIALHTPYHSHSDRFRDACGDESETCHSW
jgi:hypothetical protein